MVRPCAGLVVGIDASNIEAGGGLTHLFEMLSALNPAAHGIERVVVWGAQRTLGQIAERDWLVVDHQPELEKSVARRFLWQISTLENLLRDWGCDVLLVPGGTYLGHFRPFVAISQNLLPFDVTAQRRFGVDWHRLRYRILRYLQVHTFRRAVRVIYMTNTARQAVERFTGPRPGVVIPYGISNRFSPATGSPFDGMRPLKQCTSEAPFRWLYVSSINFYKHQWHVAEAVAILRAQGLPVELDLVGSAYPPALRRLKKTLNRLDPERAFLHYYGSVPYETLHLCYHRADAFVYASTCETFGQTLVEAMRSRLPVACSNCSVMPEILEDAGVYFEPENPTAIAAALQRLMEDGCLSMRCAESGYKKAQAYSWDRCARETFSLVADACRAPRQDPESDFIDMGTAGLHA